MFKLEIQNPLVMSNKLSVRLWILKSKNDHTVVVVDHYMYVNEPENVSPICKGDSVSEPDV